MKPSFPKPSLSTIILLVLLLLLVTLALICLVLLHKDLYVQSFAYFSCPQPFLANLSRLQSSPDNPSPGLHSPSVNSSDTPNPSFKLLIGILTVPNRYERRHLLRLVYSLQPKHLDALIDIRFIFCNLTMKEQQVLVALEIMRYHDIIILNCTENMDKGKTYTYFSSLPRLFGETNGGDSPYDYVMKTDDDSFVRLHQLVESLKDKPREDLYYGFYYPCNPDFAFHFMSGMGYVLSWDLVEWIATSDVPKGLLIGPEDVMVAWWLMLGVRARNKVDNKLSMYDYKPPQRREYCYRHGFVPDTITVHKLKDNQRWAKTLKYFNFTDGLELSKFYHIP